MACECCWAENTCCTERWPRNAVLTVTGRVLGAACACMDTLVVPMTGPAYVATFDINCGGNLFTVNLSVGCESGAIVCSGFASGFGGGVLGMFGGVVSCDPLQIDGTLAGNGLACGGRTYTWTLVGA